MSSAVTIEDVPYPSENYDFGRKPVTLDPLEPPLSKGKFFAYLAGLGAIGLTAVALPFALAPLQRHCLPFVPATTKQMANVAQCLKGRQGPFIDLGSGDGRLVIQAARDHAPSHGYETNPILVVWSRVKAWHHLGWGNSTRFFMKDFWAVSLGKYDDVMAFTTERLDMRTELERKILNECQPTAYIAVCRFPLPTMKPHLCVGFGHDKVWLYRMEDNANRLDSILSGMGIGIRPTIHM